MSHCLIKGWPCSSMTCISPSARSHGSKALNLLRTHPHFPAVCQTLLFQETIFKINLCSEQLLIVAAIDRHDLRNHYSGQEIGSSKLYPVRAPSIFFQQISKSARGSMPGTASRPSPRSEQCGPLLWQEVLTWHLLLDKSSLETPKRIDKQLTNYCDGSEVCLHFDSFIEDYYINSDATDFLNRRALKS